MAEALQKHLLKFTDSDSVDTDDNMIVGGGADTQTLVNSLVVQNNDEESQTITAKLQVHDGVSYEAQLTKEYTIESGESAFLADFMGMALEGDASHPDEITLAFNTELGSGNTIDCVGSSVQFS
jgi:hypothetical protein